MDLVVSVCKQLFAQLLIAKDQPQALVPWVNKVQQIIMQHILTCGQNRNRSNLAVVGAIMLERIVYCSHSLRILSGEPEFVCVSRKKFHRHLFDSVLDTSICR